MAEIRTPGLPDRRQAARPHPARTTRIAAARREHVRPV